MSFGLGTVLAEGIVGGVMGAGQAAASTAQDEQKEQMQALRDQRLSALKTQEYKDQLAANVASAGPMVAAQTPGLIDRARQEAGVKADSERQAPYTLAPGQTRVTPGTAPTPSGYDDANQPLDANGAVIGPDAGTPTTMTTAPEKPMPPEHAAYYTAEAAKLNAEAEQIRSGAKDRKDAPTIKVVQDKDTNKTMLVDEHTGATGELIPGQDAVPGKTHWYKADEPGKPAVPMHVQWSTSKGAPISGLEDLYPSMGKRAGGSSPAAPTRGNAASGTITPAPAPAPMAIPKVGDVVSGFRFKGGDPHDKTNWDPES